jgi:hypothetical protein
MLPDLMPRNSYLPSTSALDGFSVHPLSVNSNAAIESIATWGIADLISEAISEEYSASRAPDLPGISHRFFGSARVVGHTDFDRKLDVRGNSDSKEPQCRLFVAFGTFSAIWMANGPLPPSKRHVQMMVGFRILADVSFALFNIG